MVNDDFEKGKAFYDFAQQRRELELRNEILIEQELLELAVMKDDQLQAKLRSELIHQPQVESVLNRIKEQVNDLHTIVMSTPSSKQKTTKTKKPTKKEKLAEILQKRAFENATKSNL